MKLYTYQHPAIRRALESGAVHYASFDFESNLRWQAAYRFVMQQMVKNGIPVKDSPPVWAWHSVNRLHQKPDADCANALLTGHQWNAGVELLALNVPDELALLSYYGPWNEILDYYIDGHLTPPPQAFINACFDVSLKPRRGRPSVRGVHIQACIPYIHPEWLQGYEVLQKEANFS